MSPDPHKNRSRLQHSRLSNHTSPAAPLSNASSSHNYPNLYKRYLIRNCLHCFNLNCRRFQIFSQQRKLRAVPSQLLNMFQRQEGKYYIQGIAFDLELGKFKRQRKWQLVIGLNRSEYPE